MLRRALLRVLVDLICLPVTKDFAKYQDEMSRVKSPMLAMKKEPLWETDGSTRFKMLDSVQGIMV